MTEIKYSLGLVFYASSSSNHGPQEPPHRKDGFSKPCSHLGKEHTSPLPCPVFQTQFTTAVSHFFALHLFFWYSIKTKLRRLHIHFLKACKEEKNNTEQISQVYSQNTEQQSNEQVGRVLLIKSHAGLSDMSPSPHYPT